MKFLRRDSKMYSRLGKNRKNKQKWQKPKGRDNKMREKRKGKPAVVGIGYRKEENKELKRILFVSNVKDLKKAGKDKVVSLKSIGKRKKIEIAKMALENKIVVKNLNIKKFLKKTNPKEGKK
ncbi:50S ribosomal protein L32e [Candidatus Pacearchaeota archaeon CG10_big_fil_rev_8_21_14_0_10_34_12]|nr:MAG: 50S ribosomal protein L32e [Candidatus Pacearchaeota archaeon CG10_big_fil_rev_8_21_14_0_10_34_12]